METIVVIYGAKILILMQITTEDPDLRTQVGCYLWCKDTNFNANHNYSDGRPSVHCVVIYGAKILILMQITTFGRGLLLFW